MHWKGFDKHRWWASQGTIPAGTGGTEKHTCSL